MLGSIQCISNYINLEQCMVDPCLSMSHCIPVDDGQSRHETPNMKSVISWRKCHFPRSPFFSCSWASCPVPSVRFHCADRGGLGGTGPDDWWAFKCTSRRAPTLIGGISSQPCGTAVLSDGGRCFTRLFWGGRSTCTPMLMSTCCRGSVGKLFSESI